ncbi:MAG: 3-deoxy-manno-octulosonate cytidylyltransferase [bacterium]
MIKKVIGIIPARYDSRRLPGKPLADIGGKPMIQWVWEGVQKSKYAEKIIVATDDARIYAAVKRFTQDVIMTPADLNSGSDRVAYAVKNMNVDIVINIQGDEPFITPEEIDQVADILINDPEPVMGTLIKEINNVEELESPHTAKVVVDKEGYAIYFSRSPIPYNRSSKDKHDWLKQGIYYKHVGIYSYRKKFLEQFSHLGPSRLENMEKLEQLRAIENGYRLKTAVTAYEPLGVDTDDDLKKVRARLETESRGQ